VNAPVWQATTASVRGSHHVRTGRPNQDAVAVGPANDAGLVMALSDGHGAARHVRSDRGAALAVELALVEVGALELGGRHASETPFEAAVDAILKGWRQCVHDDLAARPFTQEEADRAGVDLNDAPLIAYGATLLIALLSSSGIQLAQIGDGDIVLIGSNGEVTTPVPGDARLVADETTSLCASEARADFRFCSIVVEPAIVMMASDGYGLAFADANWREAVGRDLLVAVGEHGLDQVTSRLPGWLAESARVGGDDVSVAIAVRG
jgi:hypothetical protein